MPRRCLVPAATVGALVGCARLLTWGVSGPYAAIRSGTATFDELIGLLAAFLAWVVLAWVGLVFTVTALTGLPGALGRAASRLAARVTPVAARHAARLAVGLAVASGPFAAALPTAAWSAPVELLPAVRAADGTAAPALPAIGRPGPATAAVIATGPTDAQVIVARGDCLWDIAARALGPDAGNADIAAEWPRWYEANRGVIGADPDLIQPGMVLRPPAEP
jgi:nucleoid-associated protein YgaU